MTLEQAFAAIEEQASVITADETGATAEQVLAGILPSLSSEDADWLYDNWGLILYGMGI